MTPFCPEAAPTGRRRPPVPARWAAVLLVAVVAVVGLVAAPPASAGGCSNQPTGALVRRTLADGRSYLLSVPGTVRFRGPTAPLLIALHGLNSDATQLAGYAGLESDAATRGYVVAYPEGIDGSWQIQAGSPDVAFVRAVVADVSSRHCIDQHRIHVVGHSLGAYLAQRLACDAGDLVASVAAYAGGPTTLGGGTCAPIRPIAVALFHGTADRLVPIALGRTSRDQWVTRNGCGTRPRTLPTADGTWTEYGGCSAGATVRWHEYPGQGHLWPTGARRDALLGELWLLYDAAPRP